MSEPSSPPRVVIIGAGPAGLTAALQLCRHSAIRPIVLEALDDVGGISRTIEYKGNRMDIGGHRFFSKSDWVMDWWRNILPPAKRPDGGDALNFVPPETRVMLLRSRLSRIYFLRRFFAYPISLSWATLANLGPVRLVRIGCSYLWTRLFPRHPEKNLEDFFINRFGGELYRTFFKDYTEKVWGVACRAISPEWGAQRIKGLSVMKAIVHALRGLLARQNTDVAQKGTETSLIERFLYPKFGPGQMWRAVADEIRAHGGEIRQHATVTGIDLAAGRISAVRFRSGADAPETALPCDQLISSMPLRDLVAALNPPPPAAVQEVAQGLCYRDFITVGVLVRKLKKTAYTPANADANLLPDTWIYIQEPEVRVGRLQLFNNWSPALVAQAGTLWLGMEYFCQEGDDLWSLSDADMSRLAAEELARIDLVDQADVLDTHVVRIPKAYPAYFGSYAHFASLRAYADTIDNLFLVGRNGMHRYNNQDHSMLTARLAVEQILSGQPDKAALWAVNAEEEYHEEKKS